DVEILFNRINHDNNRPNANGKSLNELKALYSKRELSYNEIAFKHIDANRPREVVASEIIESL
ncbi:shikimate kinase, partial [Mammaliicoccus sciuri]